MPARIPDEDDSDELLDEFDDPAEDENCVIPCPGCGVEIFDDVEMCPHCGEYVIHSRSPWSGKPTWYIALALLGIAAVVLACLKF